MGPGGTLGRSQKTRSTSLATSDLSKEAIGDLGVIPPASNHVPPATKVVTMINGAITPIGAASARQASRARSNWRLNEP